LPPYTALEIKSLFASFSSEKEESFLPCADLDRRGPIG
jgi:hypothetical protein